MGVIREEPLFDMHGRPIGYLVRLPNGDVHTYNVHGHYMGFARLHDWATLDAQWDIVVNEFWPAILVEPLSEEEVAGPDGRPQARLVTLTTGNVMVYSAEGVYQGIVLSKLERAYAADGRYLGRTTDPQILINLATPVIDPRRSAIPGPDGLRPALGEPGPPCPSGIRSLKGTWYYSSLPERERAGLAGEWDPLLEVETSRGTGIVLTGPQAIAPGCSCIACEVVVEPGRYIDRYTSPYGDDCDCHSFLCYLWEKGLRVRLAPEPGTAPENRAIAAHFLGRGYQAAHLCVGAGWPIMVVYDPSVIVSSKRVTL